MIIKMASGLFEGELLSVGYEWQQITSLEKTQVAGVEYVRVYLEQGAIFLIPTVLEVVTTTLKELKASNGKRK